MRTWLLRRCVVIGSAIVLPALWGSFGPSADAGIRGSKHDFSGLGWSKQQSCLPCHAEHGSKVRDASGNIVQAPMWNHTISTATYELYLDPDTGAKVAGSVDSNTRLCLSCHDGTVALDSFVGGDGTHQMTGGVVGTDLSNDHPVGEAALWPTGSAATDFVDPSLRDAAGIMPLRRLADGRKVVACVSCHEPHNRAEQPGMLWVNNSGPGTTVDGRMVSGSVLCMNCHKMDDSSATGAVARAGVIGRSRSR